MKSAQLLIVFALGLAASSNPASLFAQNETSEATTEENFELSLFPGVQLRGEDSAIQILRLGLYNRNVSVKGLDIGLVNHSTGGVSKGAQFGWVGYVEGDFSGWQSNAVVNIVRGEFNGLQSGGLYNRINYGEAAQIGFFNRAENVSGFQLGIVNWAENMRGVQIGLVNIISGKESLQFLPIVNWSF